MVARDFLELAKQLAQEDKPAELRSALGRAYYALFNLAVECQQALGFPLHTGNTSGKNHSLVRDRFGDVVTDDVLTLYRDMRDLHDMRKCADYDLADSDVEDMETVKAHVEIAEEAISLVEKIFTSPNKGRIVREMQDRDVRNHGRQPAT